MIDFTKYNLQEMQAIVTVLDDLTDEMSVQEFKQDYELALCEFMRASGRANVLIDQQVRDHAAAEAEKVNRIKEACVAGAPPAEEPEGLQAVVDALSWCSNRLAALAAAEDKHFAECSRVDVFNKLTALRSANWSIIDLLADIRDNYDGLH